MRRRWQWVLGVGIGVPVFVGGGLWIALLLTSAPPGAMPPSEQRKIPSAWIAPPSNAPGRTTAVGPEEEPEPDRSSVVAPTIPPPFSSSGSIVFFGNGRRFGEEQYDVRIDDTGAALTSTGVFEFKILITTVQATFRQTLTADPSLRPQRYALSIDAPFGRGREVRGEIAFDRAAIVSGKDRREFAIDPDRTIVLGTFSTYALLPALFERAGGGADVASYDVLMLSGLPRRAETDGPLPTISIRRDGTARIRTDEIDLVVDRYAVESSLGRNMLLAVGSEFLALVAGSGDESLLVYRSDYFPSGFELVGEAGGANW